jgi:SAM-dependent methyltransferase
MKYDLKNIGDGHYQPIPQYSEFWDKLEEKYLLDNNSERKNLNRIKVILNDINKTKEENDTLLDIGCNIGLFSFIMQYNGLETTGIENDIHVKTKKFTDISATETSKKLSEIYNIYPNFINGDYVNYLFKDCEIRGFDYILYLSVWHHHFRGYGGSNFQKVKNCEYILEKVIKTARKAVYFEIGYSSLKDYGYGSEKEFLQKLHNIDKNIKATKMYNVEETSGTINYKFDRVIWKLELERNGK